MVQNSAEPGGTRRKRTQDKEAPPNRDSRSLPPQSGKLAELRNKIVFTIFFLVSDPRYLDQNIFSLVIALLIFFGDCYCWSLVIVITVFFV